MTDFYGGPKTCDACDEGRCDHCDGTVDILALDPFDDRTFICECGHRALEAVEP